MDKIEESPRTFYLVRYICGEANKIMCLFWRCSDILQATNGSLLEIGIAYLKKCILNTLEFVYVKDRHSSVIIIIIYLFVY